MVVEVARTFFLTIPDLERVCIGWEGKAADGCTGTTEIGKEEEEEGRGFGFGILSEDSGWVAEEGAETGSANVYGVGSGSSGRGPNGNVYGGRKGEGGNGLCEEFEVGTGPKSEGVVLGQKE